MLVYILKFSACLGVFLAFYKLFLEKENMHQFKRFYLVAMLLISAIIPLITFTQYIETQPIINDLNLAQLSSSNDIIGETKSLVDYLPIILWSIYGIGVILFGLKFGMNLTKMVNKIRKNPKQKNNSFINVLLKDLITPHTFFSYIFLNKHKYETHQIPQEVLLHEQTHAKQKHSIDVLFIELFQIIFWFNPLVHIIKNSIKLNHEFLADEAVINKGIEASNYQQIILVFSTNIKEPQLANAINYSSIKKRLTVMKTQTSNQKRWFRSLILLPLLAVTLYSFSERKEVIKTSEDSPIYNSDYTARSITINVLEDGNYFIDGLKANKNSFTTVVNKLHQDITPEIRNNIMNIHVSSSGKISNKEVWFIYNSLSDYGFYRLVTAEQEVVKGKGNTPFLDTQTIELQDGASRELMKEYNKLAKHYNSMPENKRIVKQKDVVRMKYIYGLMSDKQKKDAESFPNIPPPPPPPPAKNAPEVIEVEEVLPPPPPPIPDNATDEQKKKYKKIIAEYAKRYPESVSRYKSKSGKTIEEVEIPTSMLPPPPPPPLPDNATKDQKKKYEEALKKYKLTKEKSQQMQTRVNAMSKEEIAKLKKQKEAYVARESMIKREKLAYKEARAEKLKTERAEVARVRELKSEEVKKLKKEKLAYKEAQATQMKTKKRELAQVRELQSAEVAKLKKEKMAYAEAQKARLSTKERLVRVKEIQTPEPPKSPLDHVIEMAKKDAVFYLEGKKVSSDKAIATLKKEKHLNVETIGSDSKQPKVYITKEPIVVGSKKKQN